MLYCDVVFSHISSIVYGGKDGLEFRDGVLWEDGLEVAEKMVYTVSERISLENSIRDRMWHLILF
jgi:hypothetical protein